jgi:hypothetical protein
VYRQFIRPTLCKGIPHVETSWRYGGHGSTDRIAFVNRTIACVSGTLIIQPIAQLGCSRVDSRMTVIAIHLRIGTQSSGRITIPVSIAIRRTVFTIIPGKSIYALARITVNAIRTDASVQTRIWTAIVYICLAMIPFITGVTFTDTVNASPILSTIYPHTWASHVTEFSYVAIRTYTDTTFAVTMRSAL